MSGTAVRRGGRVGLVLAMVMSGGGMLAAQGASQDDGFLVAACVRTRSQIDGLAADLVKVNRDIQENDRIIAKATDIITLARQANKTQAESVARETLQNAQAAKRTNEEKRARLGWRKLRAEASYEVLRSRLDASLQRGADSRVRGMVSDYSGRVQINDGHGGSRDLTNEDPGLLEPGDSVSTSTASSADIQTLGGRGTVHLGEDSELKLKEDTPEKQLVELTKGKIYAAIDKLDDYAKMMEDKIREYEADVHLLQEEAKKRLKAWGKKFEVQTQVLTGPTRGTRFTVEVKNAETTELKVFEGTFEARDRKGGKPVLVEAGFSVIATKDGISTPQPFADTARWWEK